MGKNDDSRATKASLGINGKLKSEKTSKTQRKNKAEERKKQEDLVNAMVYGPLVDETVNEGEKGPITDSDVDETLPAKLVTAATTAKSLADEAAEARSKHKEAKEKAEEAAAGFVATAGAVHTAAIVNGLQQQGKGNNEALDSEQVKQILREQDALREQLKQLDLKRQEMAEQTEAGRRALQIAKAKALKTQKRETPVDDSGLRAREEVIKEEAATAFAAQRREIDEYLGQADAKPTGRATDQTSESSQEGATGENHGGDDMSASNDVVMGTSLRLDDLDEKTPPSLPITRDILNAINGFTLDGLHEQEPKFSDTLPKPMEETLREKPTCLEPKLELKSVMKVAQAKCEEAKNIRQGQRDQNDHERTLAQQHSLNVIDVSENGNCLFGALFAAVSGFSGPGKIEYSDDVEKEAQVWKERILAVCQEYVMLEAKGGAMRLPILRQRLKELYPFEEWVTSEAPTQIMNRLIRHFAESGDIQVRDLSPYVFWGRAAELHAAAGLLREPIYVIETDDTGHIRARRYCYQNKTGIDGISSEMGCDFNMTIHERNKFARNGGDHFQALKFEDHLYQDFLETMNVHPNIRKRLDDVQRILNIQPVDAVPQ
ncbi:hypothetical protein Plhal710r2_c006g0028641 [Plasmopara halstedii]